MSLFEFHTWVIVGRANMSVIILDFGKKIPVPGTINRILLIKFLVCVQDIKINSVDKLESVIFGGFFIVDMCSW